MLKEERRVVMNNDRLVYAGIGSRKTPEEILQIMEQVGGHMAEKGMVLRSGGARGADQAFEKGCDSVNGKKEIFLPWPGFPTRKLFNLSESEKVENKEFFAKALAMAEKFHPAWEKLKTPGRLLHARNCMQVLGEDLNSPASFIVCWTMGSGGTQQALRMASRLHIPAVNIAKVKNPDPENVLRQCRKAWKYSLKHSLQFQKTEP